MITCNNFAKVNSKFFEGFYKTCVRKLIWCQIRSRFPQAFHTNPSKLTIYLCKIPTVITETLIYCKLGFRCILSVGSSTPFDVLVDITILFVAKYKDYNF
jgi:hypothetical protein